MGKINIREMMIHRLNKNLFFRTITEACVWASPKDALTKKRLISKAICMHLLKYHFGLDEPAIGYVADEFDVAYQLDCSNFVFEDVDDDAENLATAVVRGFDKVAKQLRLLDGMPLDVTSVLGELDKI